MHEKDHRMISPQNVCAMLDADRSSLEEEMREELEEMLPEAYERLEPAAFLGFGDTEGFLCGEDELSAQEALYIICTVGDALSRWSSELFTQGDCLRAMLADAAADDCLFYRPLPGAGERNPKKTGGTP